MPKKRSAPKKPARKKPPRSLRMHKESDVPRMHDLDAGQGARSVIVGQPHQDPTFRALAQLTERVQLLENRADASATDIADIRHSVATLEGLARAGQGVAG